MPNPDYSIASGGAFVIVPVDFQFKTNETGEVVPGNNYELFLKYADPHAHFYGKDHSAVVKASIITTPIGSNNPENAIAFYTPEWPKPELVRLNLTVSLDDWE